MLWVVRHAPTQLNREGRYMGYLDPVPVFDSESVAKAEQVALAFRAAGVQRVVSSPLARARQTAEILGQDIEMEIDDRLMEWGLGSWQGMLHEDVRREYPTWFDSRGVWDPRRTPPGGEEFADVEARVTSFLEEGLFAPARRGDSATAVVTHNGVMRMIKYLRGVIAVEEFFVEYEAALEPWCVEVPWWEPK